MSGQLVGEVLDAWRALQARGLSDRGYRALIAIAEKCHTQTRQGSVPWVHIRNGGLYGASLSTAKRAVADLKAAGVIRVVKRGFNNQHGRVCSPIYEIAPLTDTGTQVMASHELDTGPQVMASHELDTDTQVPESPEQVTQVTQSVDGEQVTQMTQSPLERTGHPDDPIGRGRTGQNEDRTGHPGDLLNGSTNGKEGGSPKPGTSPGDDEARDARNPTEFNPDTPEPPRYCPDHPDGTTTACIPCKVARLAHMAWTREQTAFRAERLAATRAAIDACPHCDENGKWYDADDFAHHCEHPPQPQPGHRDAAALNGRAIGEPAVSGGES